MKKTSVATVNPLYERLYNRFSQSGKTVGEMMLLRARQEGKLKRNNLLDTTSETCITRANLLPKDGAPFRTSVRSFSLRRVNPCALLALFLFAFICIYLLFAGIRQSLRPFEDGLLPSPSAAIQMYAPEIDTTLPL